MRTRIALEAGEPRARVELAAGTIVPRLIERGQRSARIALVAGGALLLGGDRVEIAVVVGEGCSLELEDIGGTVAYGADGVPCFWEVDVQLRVGASLSWAGQPLIVADGADVHRSTRVRLADGAVVLLRESLVLGRSGERGGVARIRTSVRDAEGPVLEETLEADGAHGVPGVLGAHRVLDSIVCAGLRPSALSVAGVTVMALDASGSVARFLGATTHASPLAPIWTDWSAVVGADARRRNEWSRSDAVP